MGWVESLQRAIDYMEEHMEDPVTIDQIAKQANSSVFHFQRTFSILTDCSVAEYLRRRRLTLAAQELSATDRKIIDIAYKYGYDTPEAFAKAFRRQHGVTPSEARKNLGKLQAFNRLVIQVNLKGVDPMKYRIVEKESFQAVGMKREFSLSNGENMAGIPQMWQELNQAGTSSTIAQLNDGDIKGLLGICADYQDGGTMDYWIAAESTASVPEGFSRLEVPASKWGVFEVHGAMPDAMPKVWKQIFSEWFPSNQYENAGTAELEVYPEGDPYSEDYVSEIWIPLKSKR
ncbi:AraC family transcriptional regulator [Planomicrobium stackebrandtii]|uniref:AraC family transcriptional regulator n=1 Tax=Planomicrobium stackebrandtii TaxID=253160 RepID=A0ABU0GVX5_9BACL|nr:AraC family transcriptional regulator [Planomicrobium stackebrandtii]MDQ0428931.1 AraC family transcriptional regulator [Planomicrobium stackebrandtii]